MTAAVINRLNLVTNSTCSPCLTFCPSLISLLSQFSTHSICISDIFRLSTLNGKTSFSCVGLHGETDFSLIWSIQLNVTCISNQVDRRSVWLLCKNTTLIDLKISIFQVRFACAGRFSAIICNFFGQLADGVKLNPENTWEIFTYALFCSKVFNLSHCFKKSQFGFCLLDENTFYLKNKILFFSLFESFKCLCYLWKHTQAVFNYLIKTGKNI